MANHTAYIGKLTPEETKELTILAIAALTDEAAVDAIDTALDDRDDIKEELLELWEATGHDAI